MAAIFADNMELIEMIKIEGHTDNVPISTFRYQATGSSVSRAVNTLRYILDTGLVEKEKISAVGYSSIIRWIQTIRLKAVLPIGESISLCRDI